MPTVGTNNYTMPPPPFIVIQDNQHATDTILHMNRESFNFTWTQDHPWAIESDQVYILTNTKARTTKNSLKSVSEQDKNAQARISFFTLFPERDRKNQIQ
jgi:hypothetical protein